MTSFTPEIIEKAREAKSAEELLTMAKDGGVELTEEEAATYFDQLNPKGGELSDDELENVAGGGRCNDPVKKFPEGCSVHWNSGVCGDRKVFSDGPSYCGFRDFFLHWIEPGKTYEVRCVSSICKPKTFSGDPADKGFKRY